MLDKLSIKTENITLNGYEFSFLNSVGIKNSKELINWVDLPIFCDGKNFGVISLDLGWSPRTQRPNNDFIYALSEFRRIISLTIQNRNHFEIVHLSNKLQTTLSHYNTSKKNLLLNLFKTISSEIRVLKCEYFVLDHALGSRGLNIRREFLYYQDIDAISSDGLKLNKELNEKSNVNYSIGENLIGLAFDYYLKHPHNHGIINIGNKNLYNDYIKNKFPQDYNKLKIEFNDSETEEVRRLLGLKGTIQFKNFLLFPILRNSEIHGIIQLTNFNKTGELFFPKTIVRVFENIADQLSMQFDILQRREREVNTLKFFTQLSEFQSTIFESLNEISRLSDLKLNEYIFNQISPLIKSLAKVLSPDEYSLEDLFDTEEENEFVTNDKITNVLVFDLKLNQVTHFKIIFSKVRHPFALIDKTFFFESLRQIEATISLNELQKKTLEIMENISHQVISPLRGLESHCNNLIMSTFSPNNSNYFQYKDVERKKFVFRLLRSQTMHVRHIATGLRHFVNFDLGKPVKLSIAKTNLLSVLIRTASIYQPIAKEQGVLQITVKYEGKVLDGSNIPAPLYIRSDKTILYHIFNCLADNAVKYSYEGNPIVIDVKNDFDNVTINFISKGLIINGHEFKKVFKRNYRGDESQVEYQQGTGIGLYLVRKFVNELSGKAYVLKSNQSDGTIISIQLPVR